MKKQFFTIAVSALALTALFAAEPTLDITGDKVQDVVVAGKTYNLTEQSKKLPELKSWRSAKNSLRCPAKL